MFLLFLGSLNVLSQDLITLRNGQEISCKITKLDSATIYYDFVKANRTLSSFVSKSSIREYRQSTKLSNPNDSVSGKIMHVTEKVLVDTTKYIP